MLSSFGKLASLLLLVTGTFAENREEKVFNVLNVVQFPNDACTSASGAESGVCYTATECANLGGENKGSCANGFGVCCAFKAFCGDSIKTNNTYFIEDGSTTVSPCKVDVCRVEENICQYRMDFVEFDIDPPQQGEYDVTSGNFYANTQCQQSSFLMESDDGVSTPLCGNNKGYHMIVEATPTCNTMELRFGSSSTRRNIKVLISQIPCDVVWKAPAGCTQWYTGVSGNVVSYNYQGGMHLANHNYRACIRKERDRCSIGYYSPPEEFKLSQSASSNLGGSQCFLDFVSIPRIGVGTASTNKRNTDRLCGGTFGVNPGNGVSTGYTRSYPFQITVVLDGTELSNGSQENSLGFNIYYDQFGSCDAGVITG